MKFIDPGRNKPGQLIVAVIFVVVIFALWGMAITSMIAGESYSTVQSLYGLQALNVAEAGLRYYSDYRLQGDSSWTDNLTTETKAFGPGTFTVTVLQPRLTQVATVQVTGTVNGVSRTIRSGFSQSGGGLQLLAENWAIYTNNRASKNANTCTFSEMDARVFGNVFVNNYISFGNPNPLFMITGECRSTRTVSGNYNISGPVSINQPMPPTNAPSLDSTVYDNYINMANGSTPTYNGDHYFTTTIGAGLYTVKGNAYLNSGFNTTGVVTIADSQTIQTYTNLPANLSLICAGTLTLNPGNKINNNCLFYSSSGISAQDSVAGGSGPYQGVSFITPGYMTMTDGYSFRGCIYCGGIGTFTTRITYQGMAIVNDMRRLGQGCRWSKDATIVTYEAVTGVSSPGLGSFESFGWGEVYL
jgi:hypothetical protein